ncbi:MAG: PilZ domain-containing protein [Planctomycetes bacterium]|nr:PilZ domain-containing protein [Planctomycetota bacterium]
MQGERPIESSRSPAPAGNLPSPQAEHGGERRQHRRLAIRLPVDCRIQGLPQAVRAFTRDISTGGVYFEADLPAGTPRLPPACTLDLTLTVPPGEGHFPYQGRVTGSAELLRCDPLPGPAGKSGVVRYGLAARFRQPLQMAF